MIKRWPCHVMATRRQQATNPTQGVKRQAKTEHSNSSSSKRGQGAKLDGVAKSQQPAVTRRYQGARRGDHRARGGTRWYWSLRSTRVRDEEAVGSNPASANVNTRSAVLVSGSPLVSDQETDLEPAE